MMHITMMQLAIINDKQWNQQK